MSLILQTSPVAVGWKGNFKLPRRTQSEFLGVIVNFLSHLRKVEAQRQCGLRGASQLKQHKLGNSLSPSEFFARTEKDPVE